ncbi:hypothetical protein [Mycobacteroides abscessus]|uniref:hypothetical protein n=2 Tax=Mycobacteroides abscessus TaxID=36809 RepID=UPI000C26B7AB|nr:hypothetical protein [Mycobacteroides abscessus]RIT73916.1 hypothetical protein D2E82_23415 [Mycobacteroides abscessus]
MAADLSDQLASTAIKVPAASAAHSEVVNAHCVYDVTVELWRPPTVAWPRLCVLGRHTCGLKVRSSQSVDVRPTAGRSDTGQMTASRADLDVTVLGSFDEAVGPFYDANAAARRTRLTTPTVRRRAQRHRLLACPTAEGRLVFPTFQFNPDGTAVAGLEQVLIALASGTQDRWQVALWLSTPMTSSTAEHRVMR